MLPLPHEIDHYRAQILSDDVQARRAISRALALLAATRHETFIRLCHHLLDDPNLRVRREILWHLMCFGDRNDAIAEAKAIAAYAIPFLQARALLALGTVGTSSVVPFLYTLSTAGESFALEALARQARTATQHDDALGLARRWLLAQEYRQRDEALRALRILSSTQVEEELLLTAYTKYEDELVVWALGGASARMLLSLRVLLAHWPMGCAEYGDVARAIRRLETRLAQGESSDPAKGVRLQDYL